MIEPRILFLYIMRNSELRVSNWYRFDDEIIRERGLPKNNTILVIVACVTST